MKKLLLYILIGVFLFSFISAESIGTFNKEQNMEIYQTCNNCTYCNFTAVKYPNNTNFLSNVIGIEDGTYYSYIINKDNFTESGTYTYCYDCGNNDEKETGCITFDLNSAGTELTQPKALIYGILLFLLVGLLVLNLFVIPMIPKDERDEEGTLLSINQLKYIRPVLYSTAWFLLIGICFIASNIALAYLGAALIGTVFFRIYQMMFGLTLPFLFIWVAYIIYGVWKDKKMQGYLKRGVITDYQI